MEPFLSRSVPDFISQYPIFKSTFLRQKRGADGWFFVGLKFIGHLEYIFELFEAWPVVLLTKRKTTEDLPTAASPTGRKMLAKGSSDSTPCNDPSRVEQRAEVWSLHQA